MVRREPYEPSVFGELEEPHGVGGPVGPTGGGGHGGAATSPPPIRRDHEVPAVTGELAAPKATPHVPEFEPPQPAGKRRLRPPRQFVERRPVTTKAAGGKVVTFPPKSAPGWQDAATIGDRTIDVPPPPVQPGPPVIDPGPDPDELAAREAIVHHYPVQPSPAGPEALESAPAESNPAWAEAFEPDLAGPSRSEHGSSAESPDVMGHDTIPPEALRSFFDSGLEQTDPEPAGGNHDWLPDELFDRATIDIATGAGEADPDPDSDLDALLAQLSAVAEDRDLSPEGHRGGSGADELEGRPFTTPSRDRSVAERPPDRNRTGLESGSGRWFDESSAPAPQPSTGPPARFAPPVDRSLRPPGRRRPPSGNRAVLPPSGRHGIEPESSWARLRAQVGAHWAEPVGLAVVIVVVALVVLLFALFALE